MLTKASTGTYLINCEDLEIKSRSGNELRSTCPACRENREHRNDPSLSVDISTGAGMCHHCNAHFLVKDYAETLHKAFPSRNIEEITEEKDFLKEIYPINDICREFLEKRHIDPAEATKAHIGTKLINGIPYLAFPFMENGKAVNVQYKRADGKEKEFRFEKGGKMIPWNIDCINGEEIRGPLYITEGMMDAVALMQSGFHNVVSVPNGAGSKLEAFDKYKPLIIERFTHIVFAGDTDSAGIELQRKVKEYFKGTDVGTVKWQWRGTEGKDANDVLIGGGTEAVALCIRNVRFDDEENYSISHCNNSALWNLYTNGIPEGKGIGIKEVDNILRILPGYMYVLSGYPGAGKSSFVNFLTMSMLHLYGWRTLFYSPEKMPEENHLKELVSVVTGRIFDNRIINKSLMIKAEEYLSGNVIHIYDRITHLNKLLNIAAKIIRRHDIKIFVIDPFLYLNIDNLGGKSESTRISEMLIEIRQFARDNDVAVIVVAHPRKPNLAAERPGVMQMPYEISGSSGFGNTCDSCIWIERPDITKNIMRIYCNKCRYEFLGKMGETDISYNPKCGRYSSKESDTSIANNALLPWSDDKITYGRNDISNYQSNAPF